MEYLNEHVAFEVMMLRFAAARLDEEGHQLVWNTLFAAFSVYARNVRLFLNSDKDSRLRKANEYVNDFAMLTGDFNGTFDKLNQQVHHLNKSRKTEKRNKTGILEIQPILRLLEEGWARFEAGLSGDQLKLYQKERTDPSNFGLGLEGALPSGAIGATGGVGPAS